MDSFLLPGLLLLGITLLTAGGYSLTRTIRFRRQCPHCGDCHPIRVSRKGVMRYLPATAYHCCGKRFYQLGSRNAAPPPSTPMMSWPNEPAGSVR